VGENQSQAIEKWLRRNTEAQQSQHLQQHWNTDDEFEDWYYCYDFEYIVVVALSMYLYFYFCFTLLSFFFCVFL